MDQTFSILNSGTDCVNGTGWFTVLEKAISGDTVQCDWYPTGTRPHFFFVAGNQSHRMSGIFSCMDFSLSHSRTGLELFLKKVIMLH